MRQESRRYDLVVVGGGMAGIAAAVAAARRGLRTALVHDRPVLGGETSKEARQLLEGADGGLHNRYARETGLVEELRLENLCRNPSGSAEAWDALLLEAVLAQPNLELFLDTAVTGAHTGAGGGIESVAALTLGTERRWTFAAPLFADCTGNAQLARFAGAEVRTGREAHREYGESLAPVEARPHAVTRTLGFGLRDVGRPAAFPAPGWSCPAGLPGLPPSIAGAPAGRREVGWSGDLDPGQLPAHMAHELLRAVYGVVERLKSGDAPGAANLELEWVATRPGGPPARRAVGEYVLTERDVREAGEVDDAVAYGGAPIEDHPKDGFFVPGAASRRVELPGIYPIPLRCLYSGSVLNLLLAGGSASASFVAACSTGAPATAAQMGEAIGAAALHCRERDCLPAGLLENGGVYVLQQDLLKADHFIPGLRGEDRRDLARTAAIRESSVAECALETAEGAAPLDRARALMLPLAGRLEHISLLVRSDADAEVRYALHGPDAGGRYLPGEPLHAGSVRLGASPGDVWVDFPAPLEAAEPGFYRLILEPAEGVALRTTAVRLAGVVSLVQGEPEGPPAAASWVRAEAGYCFRTDAWMPAFYAGEQVANGFSRPHRGPNLWISAPSDFAAPEWLELAWNEPQEIGAVYLFFNTDLDRSLPNLRTEHAFRRIPECVRHYRLAAWDGSRWRTLAEERDNYQRRRVHAFPGLRATRLRLEILGTNGDDRAQVYEVRVYPPEG